MTPPPGFTGLDVILDGDDAWPDLMDRPVIAGNLTAVTALPNATANGKASVALRVELPDGTVVIAETTLALFRTAARALWARHGDDPGDPR